MSLDRPLARFSPLQAIGAALDGHGQGETLPAYGPASVRAMSSAGLGAISYRLRTELGVQAWHFDPAGDWSEPARQQGYWTGASRPARASPSVTWGYELPRRGDTHDQAEDSGYSRLDDGSLQTLWKSDPYLDSHYTREPEARHPQWVLVDLGRPRGVDALRIAWAAPYATAFRVQRYVGGPDAIALEPGHWSDFPHGLRRGAGGIQTVRLARAPVRTRFVRILMESSSRTAPAGSRDVRDRLGYAIRELYLGTLDSSAPSIGHGRPGQPGARRRGLAPLGAFRDLLSHAADHSQTATYVSSTDPWHSAASVNRDYEQPSFQTVLRSGLTRRLPLLVPVALMYGTPASAVAELRYLRNLHVPIRGVELGEEPDGQLLSPEDYGALYVQFARAIRRSFPHLALGGPGFASSIPDWAYWPDARGDRSWTHRFVRYLHARRAMRMLDFFSFEWYPFDDVCAAPAGRLARAARMLRRTLANERREGIPRSLPVYVTEYGYSAYAGAAEVDMSGALFDADTVGTLLSEGVKGAYLYGYEPNVPIRESRRCRTWGNLMLLREGGSDAAPQPVAAFWAAQMIMHDWAQPSAGRRRHTLYAVRWASPASVHAHARRGASPAPVHAYALRRPDGRLALLLVNLSPSRSFRVRVRVKDGRRQASLIGPLQRWTLSSADYLWHADGAAGEPSLDEPPVHGWERSASAPVTLAPYSLTVLRGAIG